MSRTKEELYALRDDADRRWNDLVTRYGQACKAAQDIFLKQEQAREDCRAYTRLIREYEGKDNHE
jgi:hypothetical protein